MCDNDCFMICVCMILSCECRCVGSGGGKRQRVEGEGCCGCELATMNIHTGVDRDDVLFLSTDNEVIFYILKETS